MTTAVVPSVIRGEVTLQPSYFTSSLYVHPLRDDISILVQAFVECYLRSDRKQPFALFKKIWHEQGWIWMHFKVFDGRSREKFLTVTLRLFAERILEAQSILDRVAALFGMYTFYSTQPSASLHPVHSLRHIAVCIDLYHAMIAIPHALTESHLSPLRPYAAHIISKLVKQQVFHVLPQSTLRSQNPAVLPREVFVRNDMLKTASPLGQLIGDEPSDAKGAVAKPYEKKKRGRPSKRDKAKKTKDAVVGLDKWLEKNTFTYPIPPAASAEEVPTPKTTHALIAHPPVMTHSNYALQKAGLLSHFMWSSTANEPRTADAGKGALSHANDAVLMRLRRIDEMAAERGLEVGGEGGDMTGLSRVERAVEELREGKSQGGILNLLEGAGFRAENYSDAGSG